MGDAAASAGGAEAGGARLRAPRGRRRGGGRGGGRAVLRVPLPSPFLGAVPCAASRLRPAARTEHQGAARRLAGAADRVRGVLLRALRSPLRCRGGAPRLSGCRGGRASAGGEGAERRDGRGRPDMRLQRGWRVRRVGLDDDLDNPHLVQDAVRPSGGAQPFAPLAPPRSPRHAAALAGGLLSPRRPTSSSCSRSSARFCCRCRS